MKFPFMSRRVRVLERSIPANCSKVTKWMVWPPVERNALNVNNNQHTIYKQQDSTGRVAYKQIRSTELARMLLFNKMNKEKKFIHCFVHSFIVFSSFRFHKWNDLHLALPHKLIHLKQFCYFCVFNKSQVYIDYGDSEWACERIVALYPLCWVPLLPFHFFFHLTISALCDFLTLRLRSIALYPGNRTRKGRNSKLNCCKSSRSVNSYRNIHMNRSVECISSSNEFSLCSSRDTLYM